MSISDRSSDLCSSDLLFFAEGIVVNLQGERFCNEQVYGAKLGVQMCEHQNGRAWLIIDRRARRAAIREALFGGLWAFQGIPALLLMADRKSTRLNSSH